LSRRREWAFCKRGKLSDGKCALGKGLILCEGNPLTFALGKKGREGAPYSRTRKPVVAWGGKKLETKKAASVCHESIRKGHRRVGSARKETLRIDLWHICSGKEVKVDYAKRCGILSCLKTRGGREKRHSPHRSRRLKREKKRKLGRGFAAMRCCADGPKKVRVLGLSRKGSRANALNERLAFCYYARTSLNPSWRGRAIFAGSATTKTDLLSLDANRFIHGSLGATASTKGSPICLLNVLVGAQWTVVERVWL